MTEKVTELYMGLRRDHVKALRAGKNVTEKWNNILEQDDKFMAILGIDVDEEVVANLEARGWEVIVVEASRETWQNLKKPNRNMTARFDVNGQPLELHIYNWHNYQLLERRISDEK